MKREKDEMREREKGDQRMDFRAESATIHYSHYYVPSSLLETFIFSSPMMSHNSTYCNVSALGDNSSPAAQSCATLWKICGVNSWHVLQQWNVMEAHLAAGS